MIINSVFEIMGITSIIPIISITIKNDLSLFEGMFFFDYLYEFSQKEMGGKMPLSRLLYDAEQAAKDAGRLRIEGADYLVKDGDVMHFRFNV